MKRGLMAVGAFLFTLGIMLIAASPTVTYPLYTSAPANYQANLSYFYLAAVLVASLGAAVLVFGLGSRSESKPAKEDYEPEPADTATASA